MCAHPLWEASMVTARHGIFGKQPSADDAMAETVEAGEIASAVSFPPLHAEMSSRRGSCSLWRELHPSVSLCDSLLASLVRWNSSIVHADACPIDRRGCESISYRATKMSRRTGQCRSMTETNLTRTLNFSFLALRFGVDTNLLEYASTCKSRAVSPKNGREM